MRFQNKKSKLSHLIAELSAKKTCSRHCLKGTDGRVVHVCPQCPLRESPAFLRQETWCHWKCPNKGPSGRIKTALTVTILVAHWGWIKAKWLARGRLTGYCEISGRKQRMCHWRSVLNRNRAPCSGGSVDWCVVHPPKGCRFNPRSGHIPRFQVQSSVGELTGGNWSMLPLSL